MGVHHRGACGEVSARPSCTACALQRCMLQIHAKIWSDMVGFDQICSDVIRFDQVCQICLDLIRLGQTWKGLGRYEEVCLGLTRFVQI